MSEIQSDGEMENNHVGSTIKKKRSEKTLKNDESNNPNVTAGAVSEFKKSSERDINPLAT